MADSKISQLAAGAPALLTDLLPAARGAGNVSLTNADLLALSQRRNLLVNGRPNIASRGTSFALSTSYAYTVDRWIARQNTLAQCTLSLTGTPAVGQGVLELLLIGTSTGSIQVAQALESYDSTPYQGRQLTFQFQAFKGSTWSAPSLFAQIHTGTGTDQSAGTMGIWTGAASTTVNPVPVANVWTPFSVTAVIPADATQIGVQFQAVPSGAAVDANSYLRLAIMDLVAGLPGEVVRRSIAEELALCQRWHPGVVSSNTTNAIASGLAISTTQAKVVVPLHVAARIAPTGVTVSSAAHFSVRNAAGTPIACTAVAFSIASVDAVELTVTVASGLVAGDAVTMFANSASGRLNLTGGEL